MLAEPAVQNTLLELADLDRELARVVHAAKKLPEHGKIRELMTKREQVGDQLTAAITSADDLTIAAKRAEQDLVPVRQRLERDQKRVEDGSVTDAKSLQGLLSEIEHIKGRIVVLEDAQLEAMRLAEEAEETRDGLAKLKEDVEEQLREQVTSRDTQVAGMKEKAQTLMAKRGPLTKRLPEGLLKLYEKLRSSTGMGAARLTNGRCGGCQLVLNAADLETIRKAPVDEILRCPECERILVRIKEN